MQGFVPLVPPFLGAPQRVLPVQNKLGPGHERHLVRIPIEGHLHLAVAVQLASAVAKRKIDPVEDSSFFFAVAASHLFLLPSSSLSYFFGRRCAAALRCMKTGDAFEILSLTSFGSSSWKRGTKIYQLFIVNMKAIHQKCIRKWIFH